MLLLLFLVVDLFFVHICEWQERAMILRSRYHIQGYRFSKMMFPVWERIIDFLLISDYLISSKHDKKQDETWYYLILKVLFRNAYVQPNNHKKSKDYLACRQWSLELTKNCCPFFYLSYMTFAFVTSCSCCFVYFFRCDKSIITLKIQA